MNKTLKILFHLRAPRNYSKGAMPIYMRITIDGKRFEISTQRECDPRTWDKRAGRAVGLKKESTRILNNYLDVLHGKIFEVQRDLVGKGIDITVEKIRDALLGIQEEKLNLIEVYRDHVQQVAQLVGKEYAVGTLKRFKAALASLEAFFVFKNKTDLPLRELNYKFITDYEYFLKTERNVEHNTAMGIIKKLKKIVRLCVANDWIDKDPFLNYKIKIRETNRPFLLQDELNRIVEKQLHTPRLSQVRDIFVFCCYTGLAYADVQKLQKQDIVIGVDGEKWIHTERVKTETPTRIPLLIQALQIIDRYKSHPQCENENRVLPVMSNQKMNEYLKELAERCDISKKMTFHTARHTFATTVTLTNGVPIETVSKMLGHKSIRTTQQYAKIVDTKISDDMNVLRNKL